MAQQRPNLTLTSQVMGMASGEGEEERIGMGLQKGQWHFAVG